MNIYNMKLHEVLTIVGFCILRVSGGWIYFSWNDVVGDYADVGNFVPFDNEFMGIVNENNQHSR